MTEKFFAYLLVRIDTGNGTVFDARIYSERNPSQMFGDYCFAEIMNDQGKSFVEAKESIISRLRSSPLIYSWLRRYYRS